MNNSTQLPGLAVNSARPAARKTHCHNATVIAIALAGAILLPTGAAAGVITVQNGSFELPDLGHDTAISERYSVGDPTGWTCIMQ